VYVLLLFFESWKIYSGKIATRDEKYFSFPAAILPKKEKGTKVTNKQQPYTREEADRLVSIAKRKRRDILTEWEDDFDTSPPHVITILLSTNPSFAQSEAWEEELKEGKVPQALPPGIREILAFDPETLREVHKAMITFNAVRQNFSDR
jgi:hypothetical protein